MTQHQIQPLALCLALAVPLAVTAQPRNPEPLSIARQGYLFAGGKYSPSDKGQAMSGQLYAEFQIPAKQTHPWPIVMVHGGSQTGTNFTGTPDGREGWAQFFLREGYAVYVVDQPGRGRAAYEPGRYGPASRVDLENTERRFAAPERFNLWPQARLHTQWPGKGEPGDPVFARSHHVVVGSNRQAIAAAEACSRKLGYRTMVLSTTIEGETREIARMHAAIAREILSSNRPIRRPSCLLSGGETTVTVRGRGLGGRNQEFVLAALLALEGGAVDESFTILSAGTDGIDGPTDAAGAIADASTLTRAASLGLDARRFLDDNDSYRFFEPLDALLKTGPTGTNVADVRVLLLQ